MRNLDDYANQYIHGDFGQFQTYYRRKKILELISGLDTTCVLEIGCGLHPLYEEYRNLGLKKYDTYVVSEPCKEFFNQINTIETNKHVIKLNHTLQECVETLKEFHFSLILCSSLLHEIEQPEELLNNISSLCDKDTVVHINVPNAYSLHRLIAKEMGLISSVFDISERQTLLQQKSVFDLQTLTDLVVKHGFQIMKSGSYFPKLFTHSQMQKCLDTHIFNEDFLEGMYQMEKYLPQYGSEIFVHLALQKDGTI